MNSKDAFTSSQEHCRVRWPKGTDVEAAARMLDRLDGLPVTEAASMPPGSICGLCALQAHRFVHPHSIPGSLWWLEDGCPCCETHLRVSGDPWGVPPLGTADSPEAANGDGSAS